MGETLQPVTPRFNRSLRVECREDRLTGEPGAVLLREILEASGIVGWLGARLKEPQRQADVLHDLPSLLRTAVLLAAQGWRDHNAPMRVGRSRLIHPNRRGRLRAPESAVDSSCYTRPSSSSGRTHG